MMTEPPDSKGGTNISVTLSEVDEVRYGAAGGAGLVAARM